ncbi:hypothetical protein [Burkholderia ubonensis]|uniref:hypothetical protein n=1 Tax=Burkholderia ubonensis TaxID=101571 RepID=UPI0012FC394F|nr:hypothetical protein [Burkholderia ubonensis]
MSISQRSCIFPFVLLLSIGLSACGMLAGAPYVPPTEGPTAKVRFQIDTDEYFTTVHAYPEPCQKRIVRLLGGSRWVASGFEETSDLNMIGGHAWADSKRVERLVPANKPFTVVFSQSTAQLMGNIGTVSSCEEALIFTPVEGAQYELRQNRVGNQCFFQATRLGQASDGSVVRSRIPQAERLTTKEQMKAHGLACFF